MQLIVVIKLTLICEGGTKLGVGGYNYTCMYDTSLKIKIRSKTYN